jgi:hypothetical protein
MSSDIGFRENLDGPNFLRLARWLKPNQHPLPSIEISLGPVTLKL